MLFFALFFLLAGFTHMEELRMNGHRDSKSDLRFLGAKKRVTVPSPQY